MEYRVQWVAATFLSHLWGQESRWIQQEPVSSKERKRESYPKGLKMCLVLKLVLNFQTRMVLLWYHQLPYSVIATDLVNNLLAHQLQNEISMTV